jgi:hypothetical protein
MSTMLKPEDYRLRHWVKRSRGWARIGRHPDFVDIKVGLSIKNGPLSSYDCKTLSEVLVWWAEQNQSLFPTTYIDHPEEDNHD